MIEDYINGIQQIPGVEGYVLVRQDGQIEAQNAPNAENLSAMIVMSGVSCENLRGEIGSSQLKFLVVARKSKEKLLIFPLENYYLGVLQKADAFTPDVINKVQHLIHGIRIL